jgi:hypothetical protein
MKWLITYTLAWIRCVRENFLILRNVRLDEAYGFSIITFLHLLKLDLS